MSSTNSTSRFAPAPRSRSSTVTPMRSPSNCRGTPRLSRRSSRAGLPAAEQVSRDSNVVCIGHLEVGLAAGKGADLFIGVLLDARRRVGALETLRGRGAVRTQQWLRPKRLRRVHAHQSA